MNTVDVLIVGAGPSGLLLANLLAREGISFRLIDENDGAAKESRALAMQARTLELWRNLGIVDRFLAAGRRAAGLQAYLHGKKRITLDLHDMERPDTPYPFIFMIPQSETERLLIEDLRKRGFEVERRTTLVDFKQSDDHVAAEILIDKTRKETVSARYIVGCDGSHSKVRESLGLAFNGESYSSEFIMADAKVHWDLPFDYVSVFIDTGAVGALFPIKGNNLSRVLSIRRYANSNSTEIPKDTATTSYPATLPEVEKAFIQTSHKDVKLTEPIWVTKFHVHHRSVEKAQVGRAFLAGDASHIHSPVGGQGMNTGLQDVANLAWKLSGVLKRKAPESLLKTYHLERWPVGQHLLHFTDRIFTIAVSKNRPFVAIRDLVFPIVAKFLMTFGAGKRYMFRFVSQLNIRYHANEAVQEKITAAATSIFRETLPSGYRAPNAKIREGGPLRKMEIRGAIWRLRRALVYPRH